MLAVSLLICWLTGFFVVRLFWPWRSDSLSHIVLQGVLAFALGIGLTSCHLFIWLTLAKSASGFVWSEVAVLLVLGSLVLLRNRSGAPKPASPFVGPRLTSRYEGISAAAFAVVIACAGLVLVVLMIRSPHGRFDAVAMWNAKARMIFRTDGNWQRAVSGFLPHPDYPLMLPLSVARAWFYIGRESTLAPRVLAGLTTACIAGLLFSSLTLLRARMQGMLAATMLVGPLVFLGFGASQYADFPLAFLMLCTLVLFCLDEHAARENGSLLLLAGITAGLAAWTKNEGMLFVAAVAVARAAVVAWSYGPKRSLRDLAYLFAGSLPFLLLLAFFKSQVSTPNDIIAAQGVTSTLQKLGDVHRYELIGKALWQQLLFFGAWQPNPLYLFALYPLSLGIVRVGRDRPGVLTIAGALALVFVGYLLIYVLTPRDLEWHLMTSLDRLLLHLWPGLVLLYFLTVRTPAEALAGPAHESSQVPAYHS